MQKPHAIPVFVTLTFILGIVLEGYLNLTPSLVYWICGGGFVGFLIAYLRAHQLFIQDWFFGIATFFMFLILGFLTSYIQEPAHNSSHYIHHYSGDSLVIRLDVRQILTPNAYFRNYVADVKALKQKPVQGKLLLSVVKDSCSPSFQVDDRLVVYASLEDIYKPHNPYQFDYSAYMAAQHILKQLSLRPEQILRLPKKGRSIIGMAAKLRKHLSEELRTYDFSQNQIALMEALLLGERKSLSKESYANFIDAGVVHVLSVSGLHVGIIMYFLLFLFKPIRYLPRGRIIRSSIVILLLWAYACIAGLSPSILRSVTMFSFFSIGLFFKRRVFTINMLCLSAFVLLLFKPDFIWDIGFQLSYAAVLSILIFQDKIFRIFSPQNKILRYIWRISSVTLSAQLGVLPLSLYYFHQFPGLFFLSNLLIIPFMGIILSMGVLVMILVGIHHLPDILVLVYGKILDGLQLAVNWVAEKDHFLFSNIYFSMEMLLLSTAIVIFLGFVIYYKRKRYVFLLLGLLIALEVSYIYDYQKTEKKRRFYIFHKSRHSVLGFQKGHQLQLIADSSIVPEILMQRSFIQGLLNAAHIEETCFNTSVQNFYIFGNQHLLVIDQAGVWSLPAQTELSGVLLRNSPEINLERMLDSLQPPQVIADGSNYKSRVRLWAETCKKRRIPFHYTGRNGAFVRHY